MREALYQPFPMQGQARAQIWRYRPDHRRPRHFHSEPELNLVIAGFAKFGVGEAVVSVTAGDLLWFAPGQDHVLLEASLDFDLFVIALTPAFSARVLGAGNESAYSGPVQLRLSPEELSRFRSLCAAPLAREETSVIEKHVGEFWREAQTIRASVPSMHTLTRRALLSLIERPHLGRTDVARRAHSCPSEVSRHFRRDMGLTLAAYRTRLRLLRFIKTADDGATSFLSAALEAGFGSYSQCHRAFQQTFECTPRVFFRTRVRCLMSDTLAPWNQASLATVANDPLLPAQRVRA